MARPRTHDDTTRTALLRAAGERLAEHGIDGVTVRGAAQDAGVTTRAVYALFGSRTGLLRAMFTDGFAGFEAALAAVPETDDPLEDWRQQGYAYRRSARQRPYLYEVMFVLDSDQFSPSDSDIEMSLRTFERLRRTIQRCLDAGQLSGDIDDIVLHCWATVHGLVMLERRGLLGPDPDRTWDRALEAFGRGWHAQHRLAPGAHTG